MSVAAGRLPDVSAWPGLTVTGVLTGGARVQVFSARRGRQRLVVKVSPRSAASLDWELDLLEALGEAGVRVPAVIPTDGDDRAHEDVVVQTFLPGRPPRTTEDWQRVAAVIRTVHEVTCGWPQRPGSASARQLLWGSRGADVDLTVMPSDAVSLVRACWRALLTQPAAAVSPERQCVVHGDFGSGNVLLDDGGVGIVDWDEARVDVPAFDLAALPDEVLADPSISGDAAVLRTAALAWEVATCWTVEPDYAHDCLRRLQRLTAVIPKP